VSFNTIVGQMTDMFVTEMSQRKKNSYALKQR